MVPEKRIHASHTIGGNEGGKAKTEMLCGRAKSALWSAMILRLPACLAFGYCMVGCSKKEDAAVPAAPQPAAAATPAIADQSQLKAPLVDQASTNARATVAAAASMQSIEKTLRAIGQGQLADQCITTMNQAAEQAVPAAADVFANTLKNMSVADAKGILTGPADAATQYFRRSTEAELTQKFQPIVEGAMTKCGATAAYEQVLDKARVASPFFNNPSLDLNAYVTGKTLDGLFKIVADEEKSIRENPVARSTALLKSVFGVMKN
jgi:hypothetical protein